MNFLIRTINWNKFHDMVIEKKPNIITAGEETYNAIISHFNEFIHDPNPYKGDICHLTNHGKYLTLSINRHSIFVEANIYCSLSCYGDIQFFKTILL